MCSCALTRGERLDIRGEIKVDVQFRGKEAKLNLLVVGGERSISDGEGLDKCATS